MAVKLSRRLLSTEEYYSMAKIGILSPDEKVELIRGEIITMSPIGNKHAYVVDQLNRVLFSKLIDKAHIRVQNPVSLDNYTEPEPDITIAKLPFQQYKTKHPKADDIHFIIEVSGSSFEFDKKVKLPLYASMSIPEVWLVNLEKDTIEVHKTLKHTTYQQIEVYQIGAEIPLSSFEVKLRVGEIFG
ncbi:MAG: Uma2 family endonuclease [Bacteroidota bacterium]